VVMFCDCLEHLIVDPIWTLLEFNRVLRTGGQLIITTPNIAALYRAYAILKGETPATESEIKPCAIYQRHNREWTLTEISSVLGSCGFRNIRYSTNAEMLSDGDRNFVKKCEDMGAPTRPIEEYGPELFVVAEKCEHRTLSSNLSKEDRWPEWLYSAHDEYRKRPKTFPIVVDNDYA